ncbi:MAG: (2Fe-2S)-binding protein [Leptospiraceae bacterium]|nr:(2Fe-2S)-binding protein [Leptospiraceae bacterium]
MENINPSIFRPTRICICLGLTREDLIDAIRRYQILNFEELQKYTKCSTGCGTCEDEIKHFLEQFKSATNS